MGFGLIPSSRKRLGKNPFPVITPTIQIDFYSRLKEAESLFLLPALLEYTSKLDIAHLDKELAYYAGNDKLKYVAKFGLRGELLFPVPYVLRGKPQLLGYYRLLLGFSQKQMSSTKPFGQFLKMEKDGILNKKSANNLPKLCISFIESSWILINNIPSISTEILNALTLLTLGGQLRGSYNTLLGKKATKIIFDLIKNILEPSIESIKKDSIVVRNDEEQLVRIDFASDPDIAIRTQTSSGMLINKTAIEIKGGQDISNVHNRIGEAEKSHQKAKNRGFERFITIVNVSKLDITTAKLESPTTDYFFLIHEISDEKNKNYQSFKELIISEIGLRQI